MGRIKILNYKRGEPENGYIYEAVQYHLINSNGSVENAYALFRDSTDQQILTATLDYCHWDIKKAAKVLGLQQKELQQKLSQLHLPGG